MYKITRDTRRPFTLWTRDAAHRHLMAEARRIIDEQGHPNVGAAGCQYRGELDDTDTCFFGPAIRDYLPDMEGDSARELISGPSDAHRANGASFNYLPHLRWFGRQACPRWASKLQECHDDPEGDARSDGEWRSLATARLDDLGRATWGD